MSLPIIAVTGTKGKTTIIRALDAVLAPYVKHRLRVDTEGAWLNGRQKFSHQDSQRIWGLAPCNAPGRFMTLLAGNDTGAVALLECNVFCSKACGLGYSTHKVGVFTNVYSDHIGADKKLQSRGDIAKAKGFIFSKISNGGYAVYNADDKLVASQLSRLPETRQVTTIACSPAGRPAKTNPDIQLFIKDGLVICQTKGSQRTLGLIANYKMYTPGFPLSAMNVLLLLGALTGHFGGRLPLAVLKSVQAYMPADADGRLVVFQTQKGTKVIFDYAHEQKSLQEIAKYARGLAGGGEVIGIVRLSPTRTDKLIEQTAVNIAGQYDRFIVYDKIDGVSRRPDKSQKTLKKEEVGRTSRLLARALQNAGAGRVERIVEEKKALKKAIESSAPGDVLVYIQGNNAAASLKNLRQSFGKLQRISV